MMSKREQIRSLLAQGIKRPEIVKRVGCSYQTVINVENMELRDKPEPFTRTWNQENLMERRAK